LSICSTSPDEVDRVCYVFCAWWECYVGHAHQI
jgi:hypothetical protein